MRNNILLSISIFIFSNVILFLGLDGFLNLIGFQRINKCILLVQLSILVLGEYNLLKKFTSWDLSIALFMLITIANSYLLTYDSQLRWEGIKGQLLYMCAFFIGENYKNVDILYKGRYVYGIIAAISLILYIIQPSWYVSYRLSGIDSEHIAGNTFLEMTRLSGFWTYPYWISYGGAIYFHYLICRIINGQIVLKKYILAILLFLLLVVVLTQQRAPLFLIAFSILIYLYHLDSQKKIKFVLWGTVLILVISYWTIYFIDTIRLNYIIGKFDVFQSEGIVSFLSERANIFGSLLKKDTSLLGDGIGRYGHGAFFEGHIAVTDQQYIQLLYETGIFGLFFNVIFLVTCLILGIKHIKVCKFEVGILLFYLVAMSGANCLSSIQLHPIILWYSCGLIVFKIKKYRLYVSKCQKTSYCNSSTTVLSI